MAGCAVDGGCPSDYVAFSISILFFILLLLRSTFPFLIHKVSRPKGSSFWLPTIQIFASFNLLLSIVMSLNFLKFRKKHWWQSCYLWAVWVEGPLGFGLLLSCRIIQAFQLYFIFVKRRLSPIRTYISLPLVLLPWLAGAALLHTRKPLNYRCHMGARWIIPYMFLHGLYVAALVGSTAAIHHIEFKFHELKDLWRGILVSTFSIGLWVVSYVLNETHEEVAWLQVVTRFLVLVMVSILVLAFFSVSFSLPLVSAMRSSKKESLELKTMGQALGIHDSGLLSQKEMALDVDPNEPLDKLLLNRRFRQSFMAFADRCPLRIFSDYMFDFSSFRKYFTIYNYSCLAGESVHFYNEVQQLDKIPLTDPVKRIYMARHIIEKYINAGATMEVNISHRTRQDILTTLDLAHRDLFKTAVNELLQLMKMSLAKEYWSSMFFLKFREEAAMRSTDHELEQVNGWNYSPRLSSVHCADDPFHQDHIPRDSCPTGCSSDFH